MPVKLTAKSTGSVQSSGYICPYKHLSLPHVIEKLHFIDEDEALSSCSHVCVILLFNFHDLLSMFTETPIYSGVNNQSVHCTCRLSVNRYCGRFLTQ